MTIFVYLGSILGKLSLYVEMVLHTITCDFSRSSARGNRDVVDEKEINIDLINSNLQDLKNDIRQAKSYSLSSKKELHLTIGPVQNS